MKVSIFIFTFLSFFSCQQTVSKQDKTVIYTHSRLSKIIQSKVQDTLILKNVLDSAFLIVSVVSDKQLDSLFAAVSKTYGNILLNSHCQLPPCMFSDT